MALPLSLACSTSSLTGFFSLGKLHLSVSENPDLRLIQDQIGRKLLDSGSQTKLLSVEAFMCISSLIVLVLALSLSNFFPLVVWETPGA